MAKPLDSVRLVRAVALAGLTAAAITIAFAAGYLAALRATPVEVVCDNTDFTAIPDVYPAYAATCNDGVRVVILD